MVLSFDVITVLQSLKKDETVVILHLLNKVFYVIRVAMQISRYLTL